MKNIERLIVLAILALNTMTWAQANRPKLIDLSWSNPNVEFLQKHLAEMERNSPLDGVTICVWAPPETYKGKKFVPGRNAWGKIPWRYESFAKLIDALRKMPFKQFTDNFFYLTVVPGDAEWFSDEDFAIVTNNFRIAARVARQAGLKGFLFDVEPYGKRFWNYRATGNPHSKLETMAMARQRGQEWGRAVFGEFPDIRIIMPIMLTLGKDLEVAFIDGVLSVMPPQAQIFEGHEQASYCARRPDEYLQLQLHFKYDLSRHVAPENRERFLRQCSVAPAFYMDSLLKTLQTKSASKTEAEKQQDLLNLIQHNLIAAMDTADRYIWLYSERGAWWKGAQWPIWEEKLPGVGKMTRDIKELEQLVIPAEKNLLKNPDFKMANTAWELWQVEDESKQPRPGDGKVGDGKCAMWKMTAGCYSQIVPITPGKCYLAVMRGGNTSTGNIRSGLCFMDQNRKWLTWGFHLKTTFPNLPEATGRARYFIAPPKAHFLAVQLSVADQGPEGEAFFTYAGLMEL